MSTFGALNAAYSGLAAARRGMDVVGQNIQNANTVGYTRQRLELSAVGAPATAWGWPSNGAGQGVSVDAIARLGDALADARVGQTAATAGYAGVRADVTGVTEDALNEPGSAGLSAALTGMWSAFSDVANQPNAAGAASVLLNKANALTGQLAGLYQGVDAQWTAGRSQLAGVVSDANGAAAQIASLNADIRRGQQQGATTNDLQDRRATLIAQLASSVGATARANADGTTDVLVDGNALVQGDTARSLAVVGGARMADAATAPLHLEWSDQPGVSVGASGRAGGWLSVLAPADANGLGGALAQTAASYNAFATRLATQVNAQHAAGVTAAGTAGGEFFHLAAGQPAALGLSVIPTSVGQLTTRASATAGALDGSNAAALAALGTGTGSPDAAWAAVVAGLGSTSKQAAASASLATSSATAATTAQQSVSGVSLDEESVNLLTYQQQYQAAARVLTSVDQMLDTLINNTGLVGRG